MSGSYAGFGEPTQKTDKARKRRWLSRSDEEIAEHMDNRNLPYRKGWPQLPPLPVSQNRQGARSAVHDPDTIIEAVEMLCAVQHVQSANIYFAFRTPQVRQEGETYLTLVIAADLRHEPILFSLIVQIRKHLQQDSRNEEIAIEIIDERVLRGMFTFAISTSEWDLLDIWEQVYGIALTTIGENKERFLTMEILRRGLSNDAEQCSPTLVITSPTAAEDVWTNTILPSIHRHINALSPGLGVELLCGSMIHLSSGGIPQDIKLYQNRVPMGSSIGQADLNNHSNTAGGMVRLSNGMSYALSTHHVIRNDELDEVLFGSGDAWPALKLNTPRVNMQDQHLTCPSNEDNAALIEALKSWKKMLDSRKDEDAAQQLLEIEANLSKAESMDRIFATVTSSSGIRSIRTERMSSNPATGTTAAATEKSPKNFLLDWSLSAFHPQRVMTNTLPLIHQQINPVVPQDRRLWTGQICNQWTVLNNPKCHVLKDDVHVAKFGRTTGVTYGMVNPVPVIIDPGIEDKQYRSIADTYHLTVNDCGHAMGFVGYKNAQVVDSGDSGSVVQHVPSGDWLGLLFGSTIAGAALFTPIDLVLRNIESVTGLKVVEPAFNPK